MSNIIIQNIKRLFNNFYLQLGNPRYSTEMANLKFSIKEGVFTNIYGYVNRQKCIYSKINKLEFTGVYKLFIDEFLKDTQTRQYFERLVNTGFQLYLYRSVYDNSDLKYFPSKFNRGHENVKFPFSTSLEQDFTFKWLGNNDCCIFEIRVDFSKFRRFLNRQNELQYLPLIYIDEEQKEITLGPGRLNYINKYSIYNRHSHKNIRIIRVEYEPFPIDEEYEMKQTIPDCSKVYQNISGEKTLLKSAFFNSSNSSNNSSFESLE